MEAVWLNTGRAGFWQQTGAHGKIRLPLEGEAGHHAPMPTSSERRKAGSRRTATRSRNRRRAPGVRVLRGFRLAWDLLPLLLPLAVILTVLVLDPAAVARLAWISTTGAFGPFVQFTVSVLVLAGAGLTAWAFWPEVPDLRRRTPERRSARRRSRSESDPESAARNPRTRKPGAPKDTGAGAAAQSGPVAGAGAPSAAAAAQTPEQAAPAATMTVVRPSPRITRYRTSGAQHASLVLAHADQPA